MEDNKRNVLYFDAPTMKGLHEQLDGWQLENRKRFLSLSIEQDGKQYCCIALTNPTEVIIVDGQSLGGAMVYEDRGLYRLATTY